MDQESVVYISQEVAVESLSVCSRTLLPRQKTSTESSSFLQASSSNLPNRESDSLLFLLKSG